MHQGVLVVQRKVGSLIYFGEAQTGRGPDFECIGVSCI